MFNYYYNKRKREASPIIVNSDKLKVQLLKDFLAIPQERLIRLYMYLKRF